MLTFADLLLTQEVTEATGEQPSTGTGGRHGGPERGSCCWEAGRRPQHLSEPLCRHDGAEWVSGRPTCLSG